MWIGGKVGEYSKTYLSIYQTYFLSGIGQHELENALFPIGHLDKKEVRKIAQENGLITAEKKDSTGICFIGERNFTKFLSQYISDTPGDMIDLDSGKKVGEHKGLAFYTLGQRKGLGIGGQGTGEPWFVAKKDLENNILYVVQGKDNPELFSVALKADNMNWISGKAETGEFECTAKFRYRQKDVPVKVKVEDEKRISVDFITPQRAVTPGQQVVLYKDEVCLGGGVIESTTPLKKEND